MTTIKLSWYDRFINRFSGVINKLGFKRTSGKLLDYILKRHGVSEREKYVWLSKTHIKY